MKGCAGERPADDPDRWRAARRRDRRLAARRAPAGARADPLPGAGGRDRLGRPRLARLQRLRAGSHDRRHRPGADPLRGRPDLGLSGDPTGPPARDLAGRDRHHRDRGDHRVWSPAGCSASPRSRGSCSDRSWRRPTAPRSSPCFAARRFGADSHARSRPSPASTTRSRSCSCSGSSIGSRSPATAPSTWPACSRASWGSGWLSGSRSGRLAVWTFKRINLATAGLFPVTSIATAALAYGGAAILDGSGFLSVYLAGLALGSAHIPAKRTITAFHEGARLDRADRPLPHARPARLPEPARRRGCSTRPSSPW